MPPEMARTIILSNLTSTILQRRTSAVLIISGLGLSIPLDSSRQQLLVQIYTVGLSEPGWLAFNFLDLKQHNEHLPTTTCTQAWTTGSTVFRSLPSVIATGIHVLQLPAFTIPAFTGISA